MKIFLKIAAGVLVVGVLAAIVVFGGEFVAKVFEPEEETRDARAIDVRVIGVEKGTISEIRTYNGNVEPLYEVELTPQIQGRVVSLTLERDGVEIPVTENLGVKKGEILAVLDYEGLEADMEKAAADYRKALRVEENKLREKKRWENLFEKGSATEMQRDDAVSEYRISVEETKSKKAALESKTWEYEQAFLKAPFDGIVSMVYVDVGATVGPGTPVLRLIHMDRLRVIAYVPNRYIGEGRISEGATKVEILPEDEEGLNTNGGVIGTVSKIYEESDRATRTTPVEVILDRKAVEKSGRKIRGNMYAKVRFFVRAKEDAVRIPADAVLRVSDDNFVFVVEDGVAKKKGVILGIWEGRFVEIIDGLNEGETLVIGGQTKLTEGSKVKISGKGEMVQPVFDSKEEKKTFEDSPE
jgi:RND family efflux transporter MFP subunit